jgi:hypothetical protein
MHLPKLWCKAVAPGIFGAALVAAPVAAATADSTGVCYIYRYTGYSDAYRVVRGDKTLAVAPFLPLLIGDRIVVVEPKDKSGTISTLTLSVNGELEPIDAAHSPYCVGKAEGDCNAPTAAYLASASANPALAVFKNILASVAPIFGAAQNDAYSSQVDQMVTRGPATGPKVPMLGASPSPIEPVSSTVLAFAWLGGAQPFTVTIVPASGGQALVSKSGVTTNNIMLSGLQLKPGAYQVQIQDARQDKAVGNFLCVNEAPPTTAIDSISGDVAIPPATIATIRAGLLANKGQQYYLVAYQTIAELPDDPPNGQVHNLRGWLTEGLAPTNLGQ